MTHVGKFKQYKYMEYIYIYIYGNLSGFPFKDALFGLVIHHDRCTWILVPRFHGNFTFLGICSKWFWLIFHFLAMGLITHEGPCLRFAFGKPMGQAPLPGRPSRASWASLGIAGSWVYRRFPDLLFFWGGFDRSGSLSQPISLGWNIDIAWKWDDEWVRQPGAKPLQWHSFHWCHRHWFQPFFAWKRCTSLDPSRLCNPVKDQWVSNLGDLLAELESPQWTDLLLSAVLWLMLITNWFTPLGNSPSTCVDLKPCPGNWKWTPCKAVSSLLMLQGSKPCSNWRACSVKSFLLMIQWSRKSSKWRCWKTHAY